MVPQASSDDPSGFVRWSLSSCRAQVEIEVVEHTEKVSAEVNFTYPNPNPPRARAPAPAPLPPQPQP